MISNEKCHSLGNLFSFIGIYADDLRCLSDDDLKKLIFKKSKERAFLYEKGDKRRKKIIKIYKALISDKDLRERYLEETMSEILAISEEYLKNGFIVRSMSFDMIDIFKEKFCFDPLIERTNSCPKSVYSFNEDSELSITDGRITEKVVDRKIVGCVRYGTKPYSILESVIKELSVSYRETYYMRYGYRRKNKVMNYDRQKAKNIPLDSFPFGIEQYIYPGIEDHSILLSLKEGGIIVPEGKINGIYLK